MLVDTHCHLNAGEFSADRDALVRSARAAGVSAIVAPSIDARNFLDVRDCCERYPGVFPAYGFHPLFLGRSGEADLRALRQWLIDEREGANPPVAVGEIGLDFYVPGFDAVRQEHFYHEQLKIARDLDLPVLLHVRRSVDRILKGLRRFGIGRGIAHAFNGSRQQADEFIRLGFKLGFGGAMTYPRATRLREMAAKLPLTAIVLETDAPDMSPAWLSGGRNDPGQLAEIARVFAELRGLSLRQVVEATSTNAAGVFARPEFISLE